MNPIVIATPGFPADEADTACLPALQELLRALRRARPEQPIRVLSLHYPRPGRYSWHGCEVTAIGAGNRRWPWRALHVVRAARALLDLDAVAPARLVHAFFLTDAACVAGWVARRRGRRFLASLQGQDALAGNRWLRLLPAATEVVAASARSALAYRAATGRAPAHTIPLGVEPPPNPPLAWRERPIDVLGVGSLIPLKDWATFVEIAAALAREGPARRVVLLGDGPERGSLARQAAGLGLALELPGAVARERALAAQGQARVLLHPSRQEGFGLVFAESLARRTPVVSRPVGAAPLSGSSARWRVGETTEELLDATRKTLAEDPASGPWPEFSIEATLHAHLRLYGLSPA